MTLVERLRDGAGLLFGVESMFKRQDISDQALRAKNLREDIEEAAARIEQLEGALLYIAETSEDDHVSRKAFEALGLGGKEGA